MVQNITVLSFYFLAINKVSVKFLGEIEHFVVLCCSSCFYNFFREGFVSSILFNLMFKLSTYFIISRTSTDTTIKLVGLLELERLPNIQKPLMTSKFLLTLFCYFHFLRPLRRYSLRVFRSIFFHLEKNCWLSQQSVENFDKCFTQFPSEMPPVVFPFSSSPLVILFLTFLPFSSPLHMVLPSLLVVFFLFLFWISLLALFVIHP